MSCVSRYFESLMAPDARELPLVQLYTRPAREECKELGGPIVSAVEEVLGQVKFLSPNAGENISNAGRVFKPDWIIIECPANRNLNSSVGRMLWNLRDVDSNRILIVNKYHGQAWSRDEEARRAFTEKRDLHGRSTPNLRLMRAHPKGPQEVADLARRYGWHVVMTENRQLKSDLSESLSRLKSFPNNSSIAQAKRVFG